MSSPIRPFVSPARTLAGRGAAGAAGAELLTAGVRPRDGVVALVADVAVLDLGLAESVLDALAAAGFDIDVRPAVAGEPTPETVRALAPAERERPVAAVVAVGGGSALDAGKLAAACCADELDLTAGVAATAELVPGPPTLMVPTTAGTGAEATIVAMLWHEGAKRMFVHPQLLPRIALLDAELLCSLPAPVTAAGGLDAISHAVESLLSTFRTPLTKAAAFAALGALATAVPAAYADGADLEQRHATLLGAFQAGLALNASVVLGHSLAYVIAGRAGLSHGVSCAMALPYCLAHARPAREETIAEIAELVCGRRDAEALVRWLIDANAQMGIPPSLAGVGVEEGELAELARECATAYPRPNHPVPIGQDGLERLFEHFHAGDPLAAWNDARSLT